MQLIGKCCKSCKLGKLRTKSVFGFVEYVVWCKKHRENFEVDSCCDSYEENEIEVNRK